MKARGNQNPRFRRFRIGALAAGLGLLLAGVTLPGMKPARGHVVPPEKLHPAAESYRRAAFLMNLNPVVWGQVWGDMQIIAKSIERVDPEAGKKFREEIQAARKIAEPAPQDGENPDWVSARENGRRAVFTSTTRSVSGLIVRLIERITPGSGRRTVEGNLREARKVARAFADTLPYLDPQAWRGMQVSWLEASTRLGTPGVLKVGARAMDVEGIRAALSPIVEYMTRNFSNFTAGPERRLAPRPLASPSYDKQAKIPVRLPPGANINKQLPRPRQILGMAERGVDERETTMIALGDMAFDSPRILGEPAKSLGISCNTCHNKGVTNPRFFIPGISSRAGGVDVSNSFFAGHANNGVFDPVDIPDLRGIRFTAPFTRNGRFPTLREFTRNAIVNEFNGPEPDPMILDAMIAYMNEFEFLPNPLLNKDGTLNGKRASPAALWGEKIFRRPFPQMMGGKSCASCHIPSALFIDHKQHNIGSVKGGYHKHSHDGALDTPTLLSAKFTAPYFHDGSLPTLRAVNEWFNRKFRLDLSRKELADLTAYVEAVSDGVEAREDSVFTLKPEMEEFQFFLSTYDFLKQRKKKELITILLRTVADEVQAHKWDVQQKEMLPTLNRMEGLLREALAAHQAGKIDETEAKLAAYHGMYEENVEQLK